MALLDIQAMDPVRDGRRRSGGGGGGGSDLSVVLCDSAAQPPALLAHPAGDAGHPAPAGNLIFRLPADGGHLQEPTGIPVAITSTETDGDRLLLAAARQGGCGSRCSASPPWPGPPRRCCFPRRSGTPSTRSLPAMRRPATLQPAGPGGSLAACALLVAVIVGCGAVTDLATGVSGALATARLRRVLAGHVVAIGPRLLPRRQNVLPYCPTSTDSSAGDTVSRVVAGAADAGGAPASMVLAATAVIPPLGSVIALGLIDPWLVAAFAAGFPALAARPEDSGPRLLRRQRRVRPGTGSHRHPAARRARGCPHNRRGRHAGPRTRADTRPASAAPGARPSHLARAGAGRRAGHGHRPGAAGHRGRHGRRGTRRAPDHTGDLVAATQYAVLAAASARASGWSASLATRAAERGAPRNCSRGRARVTGHATCHRGHDPAGRGELRLSGITVRYGGETVLRDLNLTVPPGTAVAVVGRSGAGKSALARLAGRLADPDAGTVLLDGTDLRELTRASLRDSVVYAFERPELVGDTLYDVIGFGFRRPDDLQVRVAAGQAQAAAFLARLPRQLHSSLDGTPLSGGEMQRLGLARAFAHTSAARLLVLDDATSSLDTSQKCSSPGPSPADWAA